MKVSVKETMSFCGSNSKSFCFGQSHILMKKFIWFSRGTTLRKQSNILEMTLDFTVKHSVHKWRT